jgi:hypothetical protein
MRPAQKGPDAIGEPLMPSLNVQYEASGKTEPGPIRFGAVLRATMTEMEPMTGGKAEREVSTGQHSGKPSMGRRRTLSEGERRTDMEPRQRLEEDHAESNALDRVEDSEPEPEAGAEVRSDGASPRDVHCRQGKARERNGPRKRGSESE